MAIVVMVFVAIYVDTKMWMRWIFAIGAFLLSIASFAATGLEHSQKVTLWINKQTLDSKLGVLAGFAMLILVVVQWIIHKRRVSAETA